MVPPIDKAFAFDAKRLREKQVRKVDKPSGGFVKKKIRGNRQYRFPRSSALGSARWTRIKHHFAVHDGWLAVID